MDDKDLLTIPDDLPVPEDDGAADHLPGAELPTVALPATDGPEVRLDVLSGRTVVFAYPRTGTPGEPSLGGDEAWNAIPGARGCTPEVCSVRDLHDEFGALGVRVYGLSTQTTEEQAEAAQRLHLPYPLLSDARLELAIAMRLPTFAVEGTTLIKRITLLIEDGLVTGVQYPVFPPDGAADRALAALR